MHKYKDRRLSHKRPNCFPPMTAVFFKKMAVFLGMNNMQDSVHKYKKCLLGLIHGLFVYHSSLNLICVSMKYNAPSIP